MIAKCIATRLEDSSRKEVVSHYQKYVRVDEVGLHVGEFYIIYGVILREGFFWYLICEGDNDSPTPHFSALFELADGRIPPDWSLTLGRTNVGQAAFLPTPWAQDSSYLEKLVDEVPEACDFFERLRRQLEEWHST